jgi:homocitrate synthase NifV
MVDQERILEKERKVAADTYRNLSTLNYKRDIWEKMNNTLYQKTPLNCDVIIDDTTLREGVQMSGLRPPTPKEAAEFGERLAEIGVERLEVQIYSNSGREAAKLMQETGLGSRLAAWCRAVKSDIDAALKLDFEQIGVSHPVSFIHFEKWPDKSLNELIDRVSESVSYATEHGMTVFVHGEDSTRADWRFEKEFVNSVADSGATTYRICDTIGVGSSSLKAGLPQGIPAKVKGLTEETRIPYIEIHAHDDLGNAVENTMATIRAASDLNLEKVFASTTFLGIGDRSGGAETEKIILNCYLHHGVTKWNLSHLRGLARHVADSLNYHLPLNKAIVGDSVFEHKSGIHQHGVSIIPIMYETFPPELVGHTRRIVIGPGSGRHGIQLRTEQILGKKITQEDSRLDTLVDLVREELEKNQDKPEIEEDLFHRLLKESGFKT